MLLAAGGDERTALDSRTGRNRYGCRPYPEPELAVWSSSTGSTPSVRAFLAADNLRQGLLSADRSRIDPGRMADAGQRTAARLLAQFGLNPREIDVVLTTSGTDAEFVPLMFLLGEGSTPITNLLVAEGELGSATSLAASASHCGERAPSGARLEKGDGVEGFPAGWATVRSVRVRDDRGEALPLAEVDRRVSVEVEAARQLGHRVLLHVVDACKTGLQAPSLPLVEHLFGTAPAHLRVLVDASQGRVTPEQVRDYLSKGFMVIITGSKFYGGPSFCGAVFVPTCVWGTGGPQGPVPRGLRHYLSDAGLPPNWSMRRQITTLPNVSLILRWESALAEMDAYFRVPAARRRSILNDLGTGILRAAAGSRGISTLAAPKRPGSPDGRERDGDGLSTLPTIFSFRLRSAGPAETVAVQEKALARRVHELMARPLGRHARGPEEHRLAERRFLLGQPVELGREGGVVLRLAISAPRVVELAATEGAGWRSVAVELGALFGKLDLVLSREDLLRN
jgi:hypothetical protein